MLSISLLFLSPFSFFPSSSPLTLHFISLVSPHLARQVYLLNPHALLVFLRLYLVVRFVYVRYYSRGAKIMAQWYNFRLDTVFALRHIMVKTPVLFVGVLWSTFLLVFSYASWVCERDIDRASAPASFWTNAWIVLNTLTTLGCVVCVASCVPGRRW